MKKELVEEKELFSTLPTSFVDVSVKMQILADKGGIALFLDKETFDPNAVFGNTAPGTDIHILCVKCSHVIYTFVFQSIVVQSVYLLHYCTWPHSSCSFTLTTRTF